MIVPYQTHDAMNRKMMVVLVLLAAALPPFSSKACTNYLVTKGASADGSTMITYAADSHVLYGELYHWAAGTHPDGTMMDVYEWDTGKFLGKIKQAARTYNVVGNMNEFQVAIGETTYGGRPELVDTTGIIDYGSLIYLTLQRATNAREAIRIMTSLVEEYGYYSSGESFSIADHVYFLSQGKIVAHGTPDEMRISTDPYVRQFVHAETDGPVPFHYPAEPIDRLLGGEDA